MIALGRHAESVTLLQETLDAQRTAHGREHAPTCDTAGMLARALCGLRRFAEAVDLLRETLARAAVGAGPEHPTTLRTALELGQALTDLGQLEEGVEFVRRTVRVARRVFGPDCCVHPDAQGRIYIETCSSSWNNGRWHDARHAAARASGLSIIYNLKAHGIPRRALK